MNEHPPDPQPPAENTPPVGHPVAEYSTSMRLSPVEDLLRKTWDVYQRRWKTLVLVMLLGWGIVGAAGMICVLPMLLIPAIFPMFMLVMMSIAGLIATTLIAVGFCWAQAAIYIAAVDEETTAMQALGRAWKLVISYLWLISLIALFVSAGYMALIIPGFIISVWLTFSPFVLICENHQGMNAVLLSRDYLRGRFWPVFGRLLLIGVIGGALQFIPILGIILFAIFIPFSVLFKYQLYTELRQVNVGMSGHISASRKTLWWALAMLVYTLLIVILILRFGPGLFDMLYSLPSNLST